MGIGGWIAALIFCACSAIRLARFNVMAVRDEGASSAHPYFTGLPTPAAAAFMMLPLMLSFEFKNAVFYNPMFYLTLIAFTSILMVSTVPTPSLKYVRITRSVKLLLGLFVCLFAPLLITAPWATLSASLALYLATIPFVIRAAYRARHAHALAVAEDDDTLMNSDSDDDEPKFHVR